MSNLVIVAIPDENDRVWKISSEKVPHLSLLFLGDSDQVSNLEQIVLFVEHASSLMGRFHLSVDRRGELGADQADVIFFKKNRYEYKAIRDFRATLLQDNNIKTAHDSATQFEGPWNPHLTLGYPATPAKPDPDDYRLYSVEFTKISVWIDDYDGPEFLLKDWWDEYETLDTIPMDVAMSDIQHYGVKGQRWGVTREHVERAAESSQSPIGKTVREAGKFARDVEFEAHTQTGKDEHGFEIKSQAHEKIVDEAHKAWGKEDLPKLKSRHPNAGFAKRLLKPLSKDAKAYRADAKATYIKRLETTANSMKNVSGTREYTIREHGGDLPQSKYYWEVSSREVRHAVDDVSILLEVVMNEDGYITDLKKQKSMAQTVDLGAEFLAHYGVKGQKWGVRKSPETGLTEGETKREGIQRYLDPQGHDVGTDVAKVGIGILVPIVAPVTWPAAIRIVRGGARGIPKKTLDRQERKFAKNAMSPKTFVAIHNGASEKVNREVVGINKRYSNDDLKNPEKKKQYDGEVNKLMQDSYRESANSLTNKANTMHLDLEFKNDGMDFTIHAKQGPGTPQPQRVKHAATDDLENEEITVEITGKIKRNALGYIVGLDFDGFDESSAKHSATDLGAEFILEHFGIKGMRWGRRTAPEAVAPTATSRVPHGTRRKTKIKAEGGENHPAHEDAIKVAQARVKLKKSGTAALSNQELRDVASRLQLENQVGILTSSKGKLFVSRQFETETQNLARQGVQKGVRTGVSGAPDVARKIRRGAAVAATTAALV